MKFAITLSLELFYAAILKDPETGHLIKDDVNEREVKFYENLETTDDPILKQLREFVPRYYGMKSAESEEDGKGDLLQCKEQDSVTSYKYYQST